MLLIRAAQWETLRDAATENLARGLAAELRRSFAEPLAGLSEQALRDLVRRSMRGALAYALTERADVRDFVRLCARLGWDFDEQADNAWMREELTDPDVTHPGQRLENLLRRLEHLEHLERRNARALQDFQRDLGALPAVE